MPPARMQDTRPRVTDRALGRFVTGPPGRALGFAIDFSLALSAMGAHLLRQWLARNDRT